MSNFDLSKLPDLLARLDERLPASGLPFTDHWQSERREAAAAIRALMGERDRAIATERAAVWVAASDEAEIDGALASFGYIGNENAVSRADEIKDAVRFACNKAVAAEREACAKVCDDAARSLTAEGDHVAYYVAKCAALIRARN